MSELRSHPLRAVTFLAPGIPREFYEIVIDRVAQAIGRRITLEVDSRSSGPMHGDPDPFTDGRADLGFLCSPSYLYLRAQARPPVVLVPAGFVFDDPRHDREPVYYSDVIVRTDHPARSFADLEGSIWGYNDECSLSGHFATLQKLAAIGCNGAFFTRRTRTGSHHASIEAALAGTIDGAAIDSTVLALARRARPDLADRLRVIESWGPFPIQPVVLRAGLAEELQDRAAAALLALTHDPSTAAHLARFGLRDCVPIADSAYDAERRALEALGHIPRTHDRPWPLQT